MMNQFCRASRATSEGHLNPNKINVNLCGRTARRLKKMKGG